ncbi:universal stress protein [Natrinema salaciae]|uniref:Nucleotide-binding universal stress protein, UspA family n=1 Tax=Natrinema salaciae TaxID=1186196 RepID=A0A1H9SSZ4_9EURY|nr:universal stress protein [Natrinema salaciae]SER87523.1 Nucleotide-binding universal stress protein, UspA family [Natrinema salaciae]
MYDDILVPTDGREGTDRAIDEAIGLAGEHDATLHTLYVVNSAAIAPGIDFDDLEEIGRQAVEYVRDRAAAAGVEHVECDVTHGLRHRSILAYADEHGIDLIVLGRHRELDHLVRGSVSKRVSEAASVPVLIVE